MGLSLQNQVQSWKALKALVAKVPDATLRNAMMANYRKRAMAEWGYCPDTGTVAKKAQPVVLDDWEQEFVDDIRKAELFEIDTRVDKRKATAKEAHARMMDFVSKGGSLSDIPADVRSSTIDRLYFDCVFEQMDQLVEAL